MTAGERTRYYSTRPRRVPPEFCTDDVLEACSLLAALTLYRVISQADDQGRLPGHAKYVRGICFPLRPGVTVAKVSVALDELVEAGFLLRYQVEGRTFLQVDRWKDLQGKWGRRAYPSRYPPLPGWTHDWISVKDGDDDAEVRAPAAQSASDVRTPFPFPFPFPSTIPLTVPSTGLSSPAGKDYGSGKVETSQGEVVEGRDNGASTSARAPTGRGVVS